MSENNTLSKRESAELFNTIPKQAGLELSKEDSKQVHEMVEKELASGETKRYSFIAAEDVKND